MCLPPSPRVGRPTGRHAWCPAASSGRRRVAPPAAWKTRPRAGDAPGPRGMRPRPAAPRGRCARRSPGPPPSPP
eukprot:489231-Pleurochrysis_carterae.AAC.1